MKKIILSTVAITTLALTGAHANTHSELKKIKASMSEMTQRLSEIEAENKKLSKATPLFAKASKLKFSSLTYFGFTNTKNVDPTIPSKSDFAIRRAYFQVKAYMMEDPKSYYRVTFDLTKEAGGSEKVRAKYAYVYLNNVFSNTGVEVGLAHRPWHDYEEHNAWYYRNISKVLLESKNGADLSNSADYGVMFKTRTKYFEADYGLFSGEGYHGNQNGNGLSFEWRTTAHLLGVAGKDKQTSKTYFDASFFGQINKKHKNILVGGVTEAQDLKFYGLHTVYNQPEFLLSAQYMYSSDTSNIVGNVSAQAGKGYSVNGEYRLGDEKQYRVFARYDAWTPKTTQLTQKTTIAGVAWEQNRNLQWVANVTKTNNQIVAPTVAQDTTKLMLTAEIKF